MRDKSTVDMNPLKGLEEHHDSLPKCVDKYRTKSIPRVNLQVKGKLPCSSKMSKKFAQTAEKLNKNVWTCSVCFMNFGNASQLKSHTKRHVHLCKHCKNSFQLKRELQQHIDEVHTLKESYPCSECNVVCKCKQSLREHYVRKHTEGHNYVCNVCNKRFKMKNDLYMHVQSIHGDDREAVCDVCGKTYRNSFALKKHLSYAHNDRRFSCHVCKRKLATQESLEQHCRLHDRRDRAVCQLCGKTFSSNESLREHIRIHSGIRPYNCTVCDKTFKRQSTYKQHLLTHSGVKAYVCDVCGKSFTQKPGLITHRKRHSGPLMPLPTMSINYIIKDLLKTDATKGTFTELLQMNNIKIEGSRGSHPFLAGMTASIAEASDMDGKKNAAAVRKSLRVHYACDICSFLCRTKGSLRKHAQLHRNTCRLCGERFTASDKLEIHMVVNHGEAKYSCQLCYIVTWSVQDMTEHFTTRHLDSTHNNCSICNKEYKSKIGIQRHMYKHHCSVSVACTICRRVYKSLYALRSHTRLVHLKSGYQCGICRRRVATSASLEAHMRRHGPTGQATNPDTYVCTTCGETFLNKRDLKSHVSTHGRIKPHVCPVCRKAFELRRVQVQHILTHMNNPLYVCDVCGMKYSRRATLLRHRSTHPGPLGALPEIPVTDIVTEFVKNYLNESRNLPNS